MASGRRTLRAFRALLGAGFAADAPRATALLATTIAGAVGGALTALWVKLLIDGAVRSEGRLVLIGAVGLGASQTLLWLGFLANFTLSTRVDETTGHLLQRRVVDAVLQPWSIAHLENPETLSVIERLRGQSDELGRMGSAVAWNLGTVLGAVSVVALLAFVHPALLALPVLAVPSLYAANRSQRLLQEVWVTAAQRRHSARQLFDVATTAGAAKEVRLFGLRRALVARHERLWDSIEAEETAIRRRSVLWGVAGSLLFGVGYLAAIGFVGVRVTRGQATAGDLLLTFVLAGQVNQQAAGAVAILPYFIRGLTLMGLLLELEEEAVGGPLPGRPAPAPRRLHDGIRFDDVSFRYPGGNADVLTGVTLDLPAGRTVALVGDNGAGKTTLVKLLSAMYAPTHGRLTVDGVDLARIPPEQWRLRCAGGFQDFARFELPAGETVGIGDLPNAGDEQAVLDALRRAVADDVVGTLPAGLATQLGRSFSGGHELSGGQWQKLAIARAMMRPAPLLLVLDEPTASLDAESEQRLFSRYSEAARRLGAGTGGITVLVSHRFSTVRTADVIIVVDGGRVVDTGSHDELVSRGGLYAELYELQAMQYR